MPPIGLGHIRLRKGVKGDTWEVRAYAGRHPETGKKRYVTRTVRGGKRDAQRVLTQVGHCRFLRSAGATWAAPSLRTPGRLRRRGRHHRRVLGKGGPVWTNHRHDKEMPVAPIARPRLHHIALTVTDVDASVSWYEDVFGLKFVMEVPHPGGTGMLLADESLELAIVLHRHDTNDGTVFSETVTGLDHVGLLVPTRADLEAWQAHLQAHGVAAKAVADTPLTQSPIADEPYGSVLVFRDPDNIQLELVSLRDA